MSRQVTPGSAFPSTHWSMVSQAGSPACQAQAEALSRLLSRYYPALVTYVRSRYRGRLSPERTDDLIQGFITHKILESAIIRRADRNRGRFRSFLLTALDRYIDLPPFYVPAVMRV